MAIMAKDSGGKDFKKVPAGCHFAICNMIVDCGLQEGFNGKPQHKVYIRWEVPDERVEWQDRDGRTHEGPCSIGSLYTLSLSEKANLRKALENWRGVPFTAEDLKGFDITKVLGKCCQIMVQHSEDGKYANVTGIVGLAREQKDRARHAKPENELIAYSIDEHDEATFEKLPNWLKEKIQNRMKEPTEPVPSTGNSRDDFDDDVPF